MGKPEKQESPFKTPYGPLTRREVIQLLRRPLRQPLWDLCLLVSGFNPNNHAYAAKWANGEGGGTPARIFTMAVTKAGREALGMTDTKPTQLIVRAEFMAWLKVQVGEPLEAEHLATDIVARTLNDYQGYLATAAGSPAREDFIDNLPGANLELEPEERNRQICAHIDALIKQYKPEGNKKTRVTAMAELMIKNNEPLAKNANGGFFKPDTLRNYYEQGNLKNKKLLS